jgi:hypothetical protein
MLGKRSGSWACSRRTRCTGTSLASERSTDKRRSAFDLQSQVALGIELEMRPFAKSSLQEFRVRLILHDQRLFG